MKCSDIPDDLVIRLAADWKAEPRRSVGVVEALVQRGFPEKLAYRKVERLVYRGLLEYGTSPRYAWPTVEVER